MKDEKKMNSKIDTSDPQFRNALNLVKFTSQSVFLTGKAGTGKSTFIHYICEHTKKKYVVLAPTGIAAINAGGVTLHSFFKLPFHPLVPTDCRYEGRKIREFLKYTKERCKLIKNTDLFIIDEISMVRADIIDFIDRILRTYSGHPRLPFGGKQMLFVGDVFQLEPVVGRDESDILRRFYETPFFFSARVFSSIRLVCVELSKVYRQKELSFITLLDHIRTNHVMPADLQLLNTRVEPNESLSPGNKESLIMDSDNPHLLITLAARRDTVDTINSSRLLRLDGDVFQFQGEVKGDFPESSLPAPLNLELKVGAQVIFIKNDQKRRWVNGTLAVITEISENADILTVVTDSGDTHDVERVQWENVRYFYNEQEKRIEEECIGTFVQFPLRLAWAITIHKSQGLTFDHVRVDFSGGTFAGGQTYVALSRCRSLDGLLLSQPISQEDIFVNTSIVRFAQNYNDQHAVDVALRRADADIHYSYANESFDIGDYGKCIDEMITAMHSRYDIENDWAKRFIRRKLSVITLLHNRIQHLGELLKQKCDENKSLRKQLATLADEYVTLAKQSLEMDDLSSAVANYNKAISLNSKNIDAYVGKSQALIIGGRFQEALSTVNSALEISPNHFLALYVKAKILYNLQHYEQAEGLLDRCTSLKPENISAHSLLGDVFTAQEKDDLAAIQYAIVLQLRKKKESGK